MIRGAARIRFCSVQSNAARTKWRNTENAKIGGGVVSCRIFTAITKSHPQYSEVIKSDLDKCLPSLQDVQSAFVKVRQICVVGEPVGVESGVKFNQIEAEAAPAL